MRHTFFCTFLSETSKGLFTWSGGPRSSGVGFFCFHALGDTKQKKPTPLNCGPPLHVNRVLAKRFKEKMSYVFLLTLFFTLAHFHLVLVAARISHFVTAAKKFSCCSSNKKMSPVFSRSRSLSPYFSLCFAGLPPTFSCSIFQICGHDN